MKRSAVEIVEYYRHERKDPDEIFAIYEEISKLPESEAEAFRKTGIGDLIEMDYITAIEMKKKGTWDKYREEWKEQKKKTEKELLQEYLDKFGIEKPNRE